jgi:hypothetical protein
MGVMALLWRNRKWLRVLAELVERLIKAGKEARVIRKEVIARVEKDDDIRAAFAAAELRAANDRIDKIREGTRT